MAGPLSPCTEERSGSVGLLVPSPPEPKLGKVTTVLPPRTSTPGTEGEPLVAFPAPPGPGVGEIPPWAFGSEPRLAPVLPAPEPSPVKPLPGPLPEPIPEPSPRPPRPGLSPPLGDMASEPLPPFPGNPTVEPGWDDKTIPELSLLPFPPFDGASTDPTSPGPPRPAPFLPLPEPNGVEPPPRPGGGGITLLARVLPLPVPPPPAPPPETDGGGGITFVPGELFGAPRRAPEDPPAALPEPPADGGG